MNIFGGSIAGLVSYWPFRSKPAKPAYTSDDYDTILFSEKQEKKEEKKVEIEPTVNNNQGEHRRGKITKLEGSYGLIDNKFYFELDDVVDKNIKVGQAVNFFAYKPDEHSDYKVKQISVVTDWDGNVGNKEIESSVVSQSGTVFQKEIMVQVKKREKRTIFFDDGFKCDLDKMKSEFSPIPGDWATLHADVERIVEEGKLPKERIVHVYNLQAVRPKPFYGKITALNEDKGEIIEGIINGEVYFRKESCEPGYVPKLNDTVLAHIIESVQGQLLFRATVVLAVEAGVNAQSSLLANIEEEKLFDSKYGVSLSVECDNKSLKIGDTTTFTIKIENAGTEKQLLCNAQLKKLKYCMQLTSNMDTIICILPNSCHTLTVEAKAKSPGFFTDLFLLSFKGRWSIACLLDFYVDVGVEQDYPMVNYKPVPPRFAQRADAIRKVATNRGFQNLVPGRRPIKPASFIPITLEHFPIPKGIKDIYLSDKDGMCRKNKDIEADLIKLYPSLLEELNANNYLNKFHTLLHMEDIEMEINIKKYDRERACFVSRGDYLGLEIPNLAESRPSLALGDKIVASDPIIFRQNKQDVVCYEGYIHKVCHDMILLQFKESFQNEFISKDYKIEFFHNRGPIRRCHQAIKVVVEKLSWSWLFPDSLGQLKPLQVNVVGEFPAQHVDKPHICKPIEAEKSGKMAKKVSKLMDMMNDMETDDDDDNDDDDENENKKPPAPEPVKENFKHEYSNMNEMPMKKEIVWEGGKTKTGDVAGMADFDTTRSGVKPRDVIIRWVNPDLNIYQKEAIRNILKGVARPLPYVIFGPPGTGKTITVVETVIQITHLMPDSRILVATPSNSSADLICERLISWNLKLLRPGYLVRLVGYNYMLENRMADSLRAYVTCIDMKTSGREEQQHYDDQGIRHSNRESIGRSRITIGTCVSLGALYSLGFPKNHFTHIIIDEAGQATEPEILIPLAFLSKDTQAILAGDPRQLGPVVSSPVAKSMGLGESLLHRLLMRYLYQRDQESFEDTDGFDPRLVTRLLVNYRSLPEILDFYSTLFYEGKLIAKVCPECSPESKLQNMLKTEMRQNVFDHLSGVVFHGVRGVNLQDEDSPSWYNDHESCLVHQYVNMLYSLGVSHNDIGIITPYQKQVMRIRELLRDRELELPKIGTVEEFQGQERQIIIVSTVRSDEGLLKRDHKYALGFVGSQQRLNVVISRARAMLIIVGNPHLLATDTAWRNLLGMCNRRGCVVGCDLPSACLS